MLAHSYGATAALLALQAKAFRVNALAMVGAPGSPAQSVQQLNVPAKDVFVGQAVWDGIATSGFFGSDPAAPSYGATPLGTSGGVDPAHGRRSAPASATTATSRPAARRCATWRSSGSTRRRRHRGDDHTSGTLALAR